MIRVVQVVEVAVVVGHEPPEDGEHQEGHEEHVKEDGEGVAPLKVNEGDVEIG